VTPFVIDQEMITAVFSACGNMALAHRLLEQAGHAVPPLRTFTRHMNQKLGAAQIAYARTGSEGLRNKMVYLKCDYPHRLHSVLLDHTELPIYVVPTGHTIAEKPWVTVVMDGMSRLVLSWVMTFGTPTAEQVRAALIQSFMIGYAPDGQTLIGGLPDRAVWDRGLDFLSNLITESCLRLDVVPVALPGYAPHLKGRLERSWRTVKTDLLPPLAGYSDGPHDMRGNTAIAKNALGEDKLVMLLADWFDNYNMNHILATEGRTPIDMWKSDGHPLVDIPIERLHQDFLVAKEAVKVSKKGVRFDKIDYVASGLNKFVGRTVEVRHLPHDRSFIEVFTGGAHLCTAYPVSMLTADQTEEFLEARRMEAHEARQRFSTANRLRRTTHQTSRLEIGPDKQRLVIERASEIDLLSGGAQALAKMITAGDDTDRLF
jgi:putative transposase